MDTSSLIEKYNSFALEDVLHYETFSKIALVHHSTVLEGSTLTEIETQVLIQDNLTPKGKPLLHSLMVEDHYAALEFALHSAQERTPITVQFIQQLAALVMRKTGSIYETVFGTVDAGKGEYRKGNVSAGSSYFPNYTKVPTLVNELIDTLHRQMREQLSISEQLELSFDAHFHLVSIHPFYDGNGRTSRLLMNFIQALYDLPLVIVPAETKVEYVEALVETRKQNDLNIFRSFMEAVYRAYLETEIKKFENLSKDGRTS